MDSSLDSLVESSRVQFDEQAAELFRSMLNTEFRIVRDLVDLGAQAWRQSRSLHDFYPAHELDGVDGMRRHIVVVPESKQEIFNRWPLMVEALRTTRGEFLAHLQALAGAQGFGGNVGAQTTSMPVWIRPDQSCLDIRYSTAEAFRSAVVGADDIRAFIQKRATKLDDAIKNSERYRHKERIASLEERAARVSSELAALDVLINMHGTGLVARLASGVGTRLRFKFAADSEITTMQHLLLVTGADGVRVRPAATRRGSKQYGEPLMKLLDDTVFIYHPRRSLEPAPAPVTEPRRMRIAGL